MQHPKKLVGLDILRGLACLVVWMSHVRIATEYFNAPQYDYIQILVAWGREAVGIFFVLSGIVINMSSRNKNDRLQYFKKRFLRIYPIFIVILVVCYSADYFIYHNAFNWKNVVGNIFMQGMWPKFIVPTLPYNTASWSITCEVFFYIVFGIFFTANRLKAVWIWMGLSIASIIFRLNHEYYLGVQYQFAILMNNSFLWLLGYLIYEYRDRIYSNAQVAICGLLMIPLVTRLNTLPVSLRQTSYYIAGLYLVPLFIYVLKKYSKTAPVKKQFAIRHIYLVPVYVLNVWLLWQYSDSLRISKILYSVLPLVSVLLYSGLLINAGKWIYNKVKTLILFIADISYPLYLVHMPTMYLVYHFLPNQKLIGMVLAVIIVISVSYLFEVYLFRKLSATVNHVAVSKAQAEETII
jgi:peptidoglycan/LPS O-acetylase OafA/YrhL